MLLKAAEDTSFIDEDSQDGERDTTLDSSFSYNASMDLGGGGGGDKSLKKVKQKIHCQHKMLVQGSHRT